MWLTRLAITRPVVIWMTLVALAILGIVSYLRLPAELNPRVDIPTLVVTTIYPGAGPQEIESLVTRPLEDAVGAVNHVNDVFSSSQESVSIISMDFTVGTDLDRALAAVREKAEAARAQLPPGAFAPMVAKLDINAQPILYLAFSSSDAAGSLREIVDARLKPRLARVAGVGAITVTGGSQREIRVRVEAARLEQYGLTMEDVVNAVRGANRNIPAGSIVQGDRDIGVRTLGAFVRLEDIRSAQILSLRLMASDFIPALPFPYAGASRPSTPAPLTVGDVATVTDTFVEPTTLTRVNGRESVGLVVMKTADANTIAVADAVQRELERFRSQLPPGTQVFTSRDESVVVRDALEDVNFTLVLGAMLAMGVVFLFLHNLRGTIIVAISLPACLVATYLVMFFAGFTLNQMTLLALSLSVGILVDDSIVVLESITRHLGRGEEPEEAAYNGRTEIGFASITLTLSDVVVFLPIAFMGGIVGAFFRQFGLTVATATLFSLLVSFTVTPSLASRWYRRGENLEAGQGIFAPLERLYRQLEEWYRAALRRALRNRWWVIAASATGLASALLVSLPSIGTEFLPASDQGQIAITVELPPEASLASTDRTAREIERRLADVPDVNNYVTNVGEILSGFGAIPQRGSQFAQINVRLENRPDLLRQLLTFGGDPGGTRKRTDNAVAEEIRKRLKDIPGARIVVSPVRTVANVGPAVQLQLRGQNLDELARAGQQIRDRMAQTPGLLDPDLSLRTGKPEVQVRIDRAKASALGVPPASAGLNLRYALEGDADSTFVENGREYPIRIQLAGIDRNEPGDLGNLTVGYAGRRAVTLREVATLSPGSGPAGIERVNGQRMVVVTANLAEGYPLGSAQADIAKILTQVPMEGIETAYGGEAEALEENALYFGLALGLAVVLVYLVMASLFNSLLNPFVIMFTLPMALTGALGALALTGESLSLVAMIGVIMLTGLMGRNAILLIDYTATLRARGYARNEAVVEACATRLRPILMTTLATIFGMLPVALRVGRAAELRAPMAIVVIGGLLVSTLLTLVVIPSLYTLFDDLQQRMAGRAGARRRERDAAAG